MFRRILITTDFSKTSQSATGKAIQLARLCDSEVGLVHVVSDIEAVFREAFLDAAAKIKWKAGLEANLDLALPDQAYSGAKKSVICGSSIPGEILKFAIQEKSDLIVCGTHGRGFLTRTLLGSVTQELTRNSAIPVLVVPGDAETTVGPPMNRILVPVDYSVTSMDALDLAIRLTDFFKSTLILLHAIDLTGLTATYDIHPAMVANLRAAEELKINAVAKTKKILAIRNAPVSAKIEIVLGDPSREILRYVKDYNCSCIVIGSHGRKGLERAILGSVTTNVLARTKIPVFTIASIT